MTNARQRALKRSKSFERTVARKLKSRRVYGSGGLPADTNADVRHDAFFVECKSWHSFTHHTVFREVKEAADKEGKIPLLVTHVPGKQGALVILDLDDFLGLEGTGGWTTNTTKKSTS